MLLSQGVGLLYSRRACLTCIYEPARESYTFLTRKLPHEVKAEVRHHRARATAGPFTSLPMHGISLLIIIIKG